MITDSKGRLWTDVGTSMRLVDEGCVGLAINQKMYMVVGRMDRKHADFWSPSVDGYLAPVVLAVPKEEG